jgi:phosphatidylglycerol lysyltransferase
VIPVARPAALDASRVVHDAQDDGAHLGLSRWFSPAGGGSFAFADVAGCRVTAGAPRAPVDRLAALFSGFAEDCAARNLRRVHFGLPGPMLEFLDGPFARAHVGDLPMFALQRWGAEATMPASIRAQTRRARNHGVVVRHLATPAALADFDSLRACRNDWLRAKPLPPMAFMTTPFLFDPWPREGILIAEREGKVVGFLSASRALLGEALRVDAVGRAPGAPNGCAELLVAEAFRRAAERGVARATLGLAPLSRRSGARDPGASGAVFRRLSAFSRRAALPLYSFEGLETFKAKFAPDAWIPLYCAAPGRFLGPRDALAVARAFAGGSLTGYAARAAAWRLGARRLQE